MPSPEELQNELEALAKEFTEDTKVENPTEEDVKSIIEDFTSEYVGERGSRVETLDEVLRPLGPRLMVKTLPNYHGLPDLKPATLDSVGIDLFSAISEPVWVNTVGARAIVPTGISLQIPRGYEVQIRPRSGLAAKHGLTVLNSPGTIDPDYRGEIKVILVNLSTRKFMIERGMRIAQMVMAPVSIPRLHYVEDLEETERGEGGLGSTGV